MGTSELSGKPRDMLGGNLGMDWHPIQGRVAVLLVTSCYMETGISSSLEDQ